MIASSRLPSSTGSGGGALMRRAGSQTSQQLRLPGRGAELSPKWRRMALRRQESVLDVGPDLAVLAPAGPGGLLHRGPAAGCRPPVEAPEHAARHLVQRRGRRREHAGTGQVTHERPQPIAVSSQLTGEADGVQHVAAVAVGCGRDAVGQPTRQAVLDLVALDEVHVERLVAVLGQQQRQGGQAVASRTARLLVVGLQRRRHARVQDGAHVRLVHPHPEGVGGADQIQVAGQEAALDVGPVPAVEPRVVRRGRAPQRAGRARRPCPRTPRACPRRRWPAARSRGAGPPWPARASRGAPVAPPRTRCWAGRSPWPPGADRGARAAAPRRPPPAGWRWRWRRRSRPRRRPGRRRPAGSSRAGSRVPTGRRSAPRRPRTARREPWPSAPRKPGVAKRSGAT